MGSDGTAYAAWEHGWRATGVDCQEAWTGRDRTWAG